MDLTFEEYIDFVNHLFLARMVDFEFALSTWANEYEQEGSQTVDAMTIIE
jgi:type IV secretory pathway VirJ component